MSYELRVKNDSGLTLIELLIAMAIGLVVLGSIFSSFTSQKKAFAIQEQITDMEQNLRIPMDFITRDLRSTGYNPTEILVVGTSVGIVPDLSTTININSIRILSDVEDGNGVIGAGSPETVTYSLNGETLQRNGQPLVENVTALTFTYYDSAGNTIATPVTGGNLANIRLVQISLTARTAKEDANFTSGVNISGTAADGTCRTRTLTARVRTRNIGLK
ncbi:MAG: prepilin-type N-terminal cleavage/methylation domain-containing protein [Nitrospinae bacterium]|nr:prepilin-type N-terminal cleavage/methylation domain-containing protein [Nitrospinota bacterium]